MLKTHFSQQLSLSYFMLIYLLNIHHIFERMLENQYKFRILFYSYFNVLLNFYFFFICK